MPTGSDQSESKYRNSTDETTADDTTARLKIDVNRDLASYRNNEPSPGRLYDRVRIVTLEAEVALLERERATLIEQIAVLESDVDALEEEIATLEAATASQDPQLQQVIDHYERIITKKDRAFQKRFEVDESTHAKSGRSIVSVIKRLIENVTIRQKDEWNADG